MALNHDKNLQIYFFCVKRQANNDFLKDVERTVDMVQYPLGHRAVSRDQQARDWVLYKAFRVAAFEGNTPYKT